MFFKALCNKLLKPKFADWYYWPRYEDDDDDEYYGYIFPDYNNKGYWRG